MKKMIALFLLMMGLANCSATSVARRSSQKPKPFVTPFEYYSQSRPAVATKQDRKEIRKAEYQTVGGETKEDRHHAIIIGTLVGVAVVGGAVAGVLLATR